MRSITLALIVAGMAVLFGGCATSQLTADQDMAIACRGYSVTLNVLVPFKPDMNETQIEGVKRGISVISPLCRAAASGELDIPRLEAALRTLRTELRELLLLEQEVKP